MELAELTRRHDLCQKIGDALQEAVGLPEVTAARLTAWSEIEDWFTELVRGAPTDFRISRTHGAAETFSAIADPAKAKPAFDLFLQRFEDLFVNTDAALLKITNKLHYSAMTLNDLLRKV
jgi:hypothetical protein